MGCDVIECINQNKIRSSGWKVVDVGSLGGLVGWCRGGAGVGWSLVRNNNGSAQLMHIQRGSCV